MGSQLAGEDCTCRLPTPGGRTIHPGHTGETPSLIPAMEPEKIYLNMLRAGDKENPKPLDGALDA
jgi:hypothetical protein